MFLIVFFKLSSGMQATMVQCRLLKEDLQSVNTIVKNYSSSLQEVKPTILQLKILFAFVSLYTSEFILGVF